MEFTNKRSNGEKASIRTMGVLWNWLSVWGVRLKVNTSDGTHWPVFSYFRSKSLAVHVASLLCNMMSHQSRGKSLKSRRTCSIVIQ